MYARALAATGFVYAVLHHLGLVPGGLGTGPAGTRWTDWVDLLVPWVVLVPAAATLQAALVRSGEWVLFGCGALAYTSGHGIHLAANSVANASPGPTAHLWDEVVSHHVWFAGVALVVAALARTMVGRDRPGAGAYVVALAAGVTWATNAVGGGTVLFSLVVAVGVVAFGWRHRDGLAHVLLVGYSPAVVVLLADLVLRLA